MNGEGVDATHRTVVLQLNDLSREFSLSGGGVFASQRLKAVDRVSLEVHHGETVAVVGESGSGKSTLGRCAAALIRPSRGEVVFKGASISSLRPRQLRRLRRDVRIVLQDHSGSLNPRKRVASVLASALEVHGLPSHDAALTELIRAVELGPEFLRRYPHELSGGQRQRVAIARAIATHPELVVLDEALSALDVSVQAQVCNLLRDLQDERGIAYLFISHDLGVVRQLADRVVVLYLGRVMEAAPAAELYEAPRHPYTRLLLDSIPSRERRRHGDAPATDEAPSPISPPSGCPFHTRCPWRTELCRTVEPQLQPDGPRRFVACHHPLGG